LFAHFRGVERRPGEDAGNVSVYRFEHGWVWMIPLRDECVSVGAVCGPEYLKQRAGSKEEFLIQTLRGIPDVWKRMAHAQIAGNLHATGNYSYTCTRMSGRRWLMVGDAYAFVDPIFSTGVYLAMYSGELAADVVAGALAQPARERRLQRRYEREVRKGLQALSWFIFRFTSPAMTYLFRNPRNVMRVEEAMISMLAGDVFRDGGVRWRLRVFKLLYAIVSITELRNSFGSFLKRRRQAAMSFSGGTTRQDSA
jgi:flavin-dependent dehydrogenase